MASSHPPYLAVGHVNKAHGTRGEIFVWSLTSHPESSFAPGVILHVGEVRGEGPDPVEPSIEVEGVRPFRKGYLLKVRGVEDRDGAAELAGRYLLRPVEELEALEEGELFYHQLLGMEVRTTAGLEVGEVTEVYELRPAHLLEVRGRGGTRLIPFRREFVREVDLEKRLLTVDLPEGFLDL
jgi:16S rRNA processing protein RimM